MVNGSFYKGNDWINSLICVFAEPILFNFEVNLTQRIKNSIVFIYVDYDFPPNSLSLLFTFPLLYILVKKGSLQRNSMAAIPKSMSNYVSISSVCSLGTSCTLFWQPISFSIKPTCFETGFKPVLLSSSTQCMIFFRLEKLTELFWLEIRIEANCIEKFYH